MTDRCDASARRPRDYTSTESSCEPTPEQIATSQVASSQAAEREAEARRNAYFASGTDEGGRSKRASSDAGAMQTFTPDDKNARIIANSTKYDTPIQSDALGNALIGIAGGGIIGGVEAGVGKAGLAGTRGLFVQPTSRALVKGAVVGEATGAAAFTKGAAAGARTTATTTVRDAAVLDGLPAAVKALQAASAATPAGSTDGGRAAASVGTSKARDAVAGQSSRNGASVPVKEPTASEGPRIPEVWTPSPVRIQG